MAGSVLVSDLQAGDVLIIQRRGANGAIVDAEVYVTAVQDRHPDIRIDAVDPGQAARSDGGTAMVITKRAYEYVTIVNA